MNQSECRLCGAPLRHTFVDLGVSPLSNSYLSRDELGEMEPFYPLHVRVCNQCFLVQLQDVQSPETIFSNYAYFSSYSETWLHHAEAYTEEMISRFRLTSGSYVVELASNDGYLLQYFVAREIPVLGIEPACNVAEVAQKKGIPTVVKFFSSKLATELAGRDKKADLLLGNNVLAHVPALNDFVRGLKILLKPQGVITMEFPHLLKLLAEKQFDTIYHEHFSYLSFVSTRRLFERHRLTVFDVEELPTHGGSLRIYACHAEEEKNFPISVRVKELTDREITAGLCRIATYIRFEEEVRESKRALLDCLIHVKRMNKSIVGYGAPAKANTLLNYCGIGTDFLDYTVDLSPHKQHRFLPGTHIPIYPPAKIRATKPDYILILPWNLREEILDQLAYARDWGAKFVLPIPVPTVID